MAQQQYTVNKTWQKTLAGKVLFDDSDIPPVNVGQNDIADLRRRFIKRLAVFTATKVEIIKDQEGGLQLLVTRDPGSSYPQVTNDSRLQSFLQEVERTMRIVTANTNVVFTKDAYKGLRSAMFEFSCNSVDRIISEIQQCFTKHDNVYMDLVSRYTGRFELDEEIACGRTPSFDDDLFDKIGKLRNGIQDYESKAVDAASLVTVAAELLKEMQPLNIRLRDMLCQNSFADELYCLTTVLAFPSYGYQTFLRVAEIYPIKFQSAPPSQSFRGASTGFTCGKTSSIGTATHGRELPQASPCQELQRTCPNSPAATSSASVHSSSVSRNGSAETKQSKAANSMMSHYIPNKDVMAIAREFLPPQDQFKVYKALSPREKRDVVGLIASVTMGHLLPTTLTAWRMFGFVTAADEEEERRIAGLYKEMLTTSKRPQVLFAELVKSLKSGTLADLIEAEGFKPLRGYFPILDQFLRTRKDELPTVWMLVQYIRSKGFCEPPPTLKRDYGFQFCRTHHEVSLLRGIYSKILEKSKPMELHDACRFGRLKEHARIKGVFIEQKWQRFLNNAYPDPTLGFENGAGLHNFMGPLFKKSGKK